MSRGRSFKERVLQTHTHSGLGVLDAQSGRWHHCGRDTGPNVGDEVIGCGGTHGAAPKTPLWASPLFGGRDAGEGM